MNDAPVPLPVSAGRTGRWSRLRWVLVLGWAGALGFAFYWWYTHPSVYPLPPDNLLADASFEKGGEGWDYPDWSENWAGFRVDRKRPHSGRKAVHLELVNDPERNSRIWGARQELRPPAFPRYLAGFYRVEEWRQETPLMYLQAVVIVWFKREYAGMKNFQVRFLLGGVAFRPTRMENVRYVHWLKDPPKLEEWTPFAVDVAEAFKSQWGYVPPEWDKLDVFFEVRYDDRDQPGAAPAAEVFYDDLYLGGTAPDFARGMVH